MAIDPQNGNAASRAKCPRFTYPTAAQLRQALCTYTTRWQFWLIVALSLLLCLQCVVAASSPEPEWLLFVFCPNYIVGMAVGMQLKHQFANPRARLLPQFAAAHLFVAAAIVVVPVAVEGVFVWVGGGFGLTAAGFSLVVASITIWGCAGLALSGVLMTLTIMLMMALMFAPPYLAGPILAGGPIAAVGMIIVGLTTFAALGRRLLALSEETPGYFSRPEGNVWDTVSRTGKRARRQLEVQSLSRSQYRNRLHDALFSFVIHRLPATGYLRRLLLRELAGRLPILFLLLQQMAAVLFFGCLLPWFEGDFRGRDAHEVPWASIMMFPFVFAMFSLGFSWMQNWPNLARESLFPLRRTTFIRDLTISRACDMAAAAAGHCLGIILTLALFYPQEPLITPVAHFVPIVIAVYVALYCVLVCATSFRTIDEAAIGWLLGILLVAIVLGTVVACSEPPYVIAGIVTMFAVAVGYWLALRRWRSIDLD